MEQPQPPPAGQTKQGDVGNVKIEFITDEESIRQAWDVLASTFGTQTADGFWMALNPGWDTPSGREKCVERWVNSFNSSTGKDKLGRPLSYYLKATAPDPADPSRRVMAGVGIWIQYSAVESWGKQSLPLAETTNLKDRYPDSETERRFLVQMEKSLHAQRRSYLDSIASSEVPAVLFLDVCVVDPKFQRRGIARRLVQWGVDEADRRGGLDCITVASSMGRHVYSQLGFEPQGDGDIEYEVDDEFSQRSLPPNVAMLRKSTTRSQA